MEPTKARIEVGPFKFDFEGDSDVVTQKIELITPLIEKWLEKYFQGAKESPAIPSIPQAIIPKSTTLDKPSQDTGGAGQLTLDPSIEKLFKKGKVISLHTRPDPDKAFLLILYGFKTLLNQEVVGAAQLAKSFTDTGVTGYNRLSRVAEPIEQAGLINISGQKKGTRYVLTNAGVAEAEKILQELKEKL